MATDDLFNRKEGRVNRSVSGAETAEAFSALGKGDVRRRSDDVSDVDNVAFKEVG